MTHEYTDEELVDEVESFLQEYYGEDHVDRQYYLEETYRFVDLVAWTPMGTLVIETEDHGSEMFEGAGQAMFYAAHFDNGIPILVVPEDQMERPEVDYVRRFMTVVPWPAP